MKTTIQEEKLRNKFAESAADALSKPGSASFYMDGSMSQDGVLVAIRSKKSIIVFVSTSDEFEYEFALPDYIDSFAHALSLVPDHPNSDPALLRRISDLESKIQKDSELISRLMAEIQEYEK